MPLRSRRVRAAAALRLAAMGEPVPRALRDDLELTVRQVRDLPVRDEAEIETFVMLRRMALLAWIGTVTWIRAEDMGAMPGTMGMSLLSFTLMWGLMMAAMMLPSVAPFIQTYQATITEHRALRLTALAAGAPDAR